ncbi:beta-barrel assembly machinery complex, BamA/YaeT protein [Campylobacter mucosalis]|uniref:Outer membrane protein assembly factor BamA n=1 Tax=Campylobacter mucosalis CCUG 21559 TaxID=1032067 RepID=A0A6G5QFF0_9BACT|nr:outer membrane protein assembly factor BamA [Campylobacter mucosalis]QCD44297.1 beta-barrel assembly machinery complex, BamA/YaeT protein [Campylobacter mucosalis CCUG 21559]QKF63509.1 beta-barrel assembly machinery complex, BamA/YaeT protein [Campylobacter mucosalis]
MKKSLFLLFTSLCLANAQQIQSINFKGLIHLSPDVAREISGLQIGSTLTGENSDRAILNLYKQGYFDDVYISSDEAGNVTINLKEKPSIARLDLKGVVTNDKTAIESLIHIKPGNMYDELSIEKTKDRIRQYYESKGYYDTVIDVEKTPVAENDSALFVTLNINRGENMIIDRVNLIGATKFGYSDVEPIVANKSREFMGWMWGRNDGKVKLYELESDPFRIQDKYFQKGYLDATVSAPYLNASFNNYKAELTYYIKEGEPYSVSSVSINAPEFLDLNKDEILDDFKLEAGDTMNSEHLRRDMKKLDDLVANKGYAFVKVYPKTDKFDDNHTVNIEYEIDPGEQVYIRDVKISGNERTVDRVIRREMYITEGNLYNRTDLQDSIDALKRTSYFDEVDIKEERVDKNTVDLVIDVKEASTGSISGGIGYGSSDGLLLNASLSDTNIFGSGLKGTISVDKSDNELSGQISLTNPRIFDSKYSLGGSIYANNYNWDNYKEKSYGFSTTLGRKITRNLNASISYVIEQSDISGLNRILVREIGYKEGKNIKSSVIPALSYNSTDDFYLPRRGIIASTSFEFAGLGGDEKFVKNRTDFNYYLGFKEYIDYDFIFRYKANFGKIWDNGYIPINEKLYLGGVRSLRGFESRSVSPKVRGSDGEWYEIGGEMSFNNSVELSFPIIDRVKMRGVLFYDYGMIGVSNLNEIKRSSYGAGIEWITPIGPLQLIFAKAIDAKENDDTNKFEFTIGRRF